MMSRRQVLLATSSLCAFGFGIWSREVYADSAETIRVATLASGTVAWELETIIHNGFDREHGFKLALIPVASKQAADIMLAGGEADMIVTDWLWVSRQRHAGRDYKFIPYSRQIGAVLVKPSSSFKTIADLKGRKIGVAGGPTDKGWTLIRSFARSQAGVDLAKDADPVFAAPPLLNELFDRGAIDALITYWHFAAPLKAEGAIELITLTDAAVALGLDPELPFLGYVFSENWSFTHDHAADRFYVAAQKAKALLSHSDEEWIRLRPMMNAKSDRVFESLKAGYRDGIPKTTLIDEHAVDAFFTVLARDGGEEFSGDNTTLASGLFYHPHR